MTTTDQLFSLNARQNEIMRRIKAESLSIEDALAATQGILDGIYPLKPDVVAVSSTQPSWYVSPEQQLERVMQLNRQLGLDFLVSDFPSIPENFTPRTPTEVLMLAVYLPDKGRQKGLQRTFDELWNLIEAPDGYTKCRWDKLKSDSKHLRQAPGYDYTPGIRWVAFDPNAYRGLSPEAALEQSKVDGLQLAGIEVLMAALLFQTWATSWNGDSSPYPNLSALQFYWDTDWSHVPYFSRWDVGREVDLHVYRADDAHDRWSSPVARECKN